MLPVKVYLAEGQQFWRFTLSAWHWRAAQILLRLTSREGLTLRKVSDFRECPIGTPELGTGLPVAR
jgi:hypothetical protein